MAKHKDFSELFDPSKPMLQVRNLTRLYPQKGGSLFRKPKQVHAVDGVSFTLQEREIFGVIGESGCGKSTLGRLLIRLEEPTSGEIDFYGISTKKLLDANPAATTAEFDSIDLQEFYENRTALRNTVAKELAEVQSSK